MPLTSPFRLAVLVSGRGSNMNALIQARLRGALDAQVTGVFSDKPGCAALALAREHGIETAALRPRDFASREAYDESLFNLVAAVHPDLIVCAGYLRLISEPAVRRFAGRMINIHPSLLPKYPGLDTHARALAAGEREHGASVHEVTTALDAGPVLAQARVPVLEGDDAQILAQRVLAREHPLLVQCVQKIATGELAFSGERISWHGQPLAAPLALNELDLLEEPR